MITRHIARTPKTLGSERVAAFIKAHANSAVGLPQISIANGVILTGPMRVARSG
jgi:hypothetical protein